MRTNNKKKVERLGFVVTLVYILVMLGMLTFSIWRVATKGAFSTPIRVLLAIFYMALYIGYLILVVWFDEQVERIESEGTDDINKSEERS